MNTQPIVGALETSRAGSLAGAIRLVERDGRATDTTHWSKIARQWIEWARTPDHDAFWAYRHSMTRFIGIGTRRALEIGCGEGRVSRELKKLGFRVTATATDAVAELVEAARLADSAEDYAVAAAKSLPFSEGQFDLVVAYNVLWTLKMYR